MSSPLDERPFLRASGAALRAARIARGLSRETLAEEAGVHPNTVGVAERGDRDLSSITQTRLLLALGCERLRLRPEGAIALLGDESFGPLGLELRALPDALVAHFIGAALRDRRRAIGMSLDEVARAAGMHRNTLWNIERGLVVAGGLTLYGAYLALGVRELEPTPSGLSLA